MHRHGVILLTVVAATVAAQIPAHGQDAFRQTVVATAAATPVELGVATRADRAPRIQTPAAQSHDQ